MTRDEGVWREKGAWYRLEVQLYTVVELMVDSPREKGNGGNKWLHSGEERPKARHCTWGSVKTKCITQSTDRGKKFAHFLHWLNVQSWVFSILVLVPTTVLIVQFDLKKYKSQKANFLTQIWKMMCFVTILSLIQIISSEQRWRKWKGGW